MPCLEGKIQKMREAEWNTVSHIDRMGLNSQGKVTKICDRLWTGSTGDRQ